jgi:tetratricopeptide (TPR) repeat protein
MLTLLFILSSCLLSDAANNLTAEQQYDKASKLYKSGNYAEASMQYQNLVNDGKRSTALFFNLANCYYKTGDYAKAILNYERAKKIARNISKNTAMVIDEHYIPAFKPAKSFTDKIKKSE